MEINFSTLERGKLITLPSQHGSWEIPHGTLVCLAGLAEPCHPEILENCIMILGDVECRQCRQIVPQKCKGMQFVLVFVVQHKEIIVVLFSKKQT